MHRLAFGNQKVNLERGADNSSIRRMPEIENWAKDMYRFMSDRFGEKTLLHLWYIWTKQIHIYIVQFFLSLNRTNFRGSR